MCCAKSCVSKIKNLKRERKFNVVIFDDYMDHGNGFNAVRCLLESLIDFDERNDEEEKICDRIAAEVLMPEESFRYVSSNALNLYGEWSDLCLISIADKYAVSTFSVVRRLRELDIINRSDYYSIYKRISDSFKEEQDSIIQNKKDREFKV